MGTGTDCEMFLSLTECPGFSWHRVHSVLSSWYRAVFGMQFGDDVLLGRVCSEPWIFWGLVLCLCGAVQ